MIPGKQYKPEDVLEAAWRRRWFIVLPLVVISVATLVFSNMLQDRYRSEALLLIVPQRVPENYVRPTVTTRLDERLQSIGQQILSRTRLEAIIQEFDLYAAERRRMIMDDVVAMMRDDVKIGRSGRATEAGAFAVGFEADNPRTALLVAERLASLFIRENLEDRSVFADMTDQFLESQLDDARRQLKEHETKLEEFRRANPGRMPSELDANQQGLQNTQMQLQALQESLNRDRDRRLMLERMIADANSDRAVAVQAAPSPAPTSPISAGRQLEQANIELRNLEMRLKPTHPDVAAQKRIIRDLEAKASAEELERALFPDSAAPQTSAEAARTNRLKELHTELETLDRRIASKQDSEKRLMDTIGMYQERIEAIPVMESRLTELMRDYTTLQHTYQSLLTKSKEAKVAANLERRQIGEQFKIIDSPRLPQRPASPNRPFLNLMGAMFGLGLGLGLAAILEYRDSSLRCEEDVVTALALPVLALVPTMTTANERMRRKRHRLVLASSGAVAILVAAGLVAWNFRSIADWMR